MCVYCFWSCASFCQNCFRPWYYNQIHVSNWDPKTWGRFSFLLFLTEAQLLVHWESKRRAVCKVVLMLLNGWFVLTVDGSCQETLELFPKLCGFDDVCICVLYFENHLLLFGVGELFDKGYPEISLKTVFQPMISVCRGPKVVDHWNHSFSIHFYPLQSLFNPLYISGTLSYRDTLAWVCESEEVRSGLAVSQSSVAVTNIRTFCMWVGSLIFLSYVTTCPAYCAKARERETTISVYERAEEGTP